MIPSRSPVAIRLGKLAEAGRTGSLHLSGDSGGVIYLSAGDIVAADSRRTPSLAAKSGAGAFGRSWMAAEATVDAAMELMSARPRHVRFAEPGEEPGPDLPEPPGTPGMPLAALMAEVTRRHKLLEQIAAVLTPDAPVVRSPRLRSRAVQVSDTQWAILLRLGQPVTPRALALELGPSVFGMTIEVYRMVIMHLVSVADAPAWPGEASQGRSALSFIRALA